MGRCTPSRRTPQCSAENRRGDWRSTPRKLSRSSYEKGIAYYDSIKKRAAERQWQRRKQNPLTFVSDGLANVGVRLWRFHDQKWVFWLLIIIFTVNFWIVMSHI